MTSDSGEAGRATSPSALSEVEPCFRSIIESLPELIWTCRADGETEYASSRLLGYLGATHEAMLGQGLAR
jgi:PAS domain-containing protein